MRRGQRCRRGLALPRDRISLLLGGLLAGLGDLAGHLLGGGRLDHTDGDGLPHVTDSEPAEREESANV